MGDGSKGFEGLKATQESHYKFILWETEKEMLQNKGSTEKAKVGI